jgi:hypothetical protein
MTEIVRASLGLPTLLAGPQFQNSKPVLVIKNAKASACPATCCGASERTTIKWNLFLTFRIHRRRTAAYCRELQYWNLRFICNLVLGIWDFRF